ncbi:hypothetical protein [Limnoglobus roseus]|uniref:Uncharacterized protein n=1 Tax=Limnoglobus roseus TaxID=2598579 RepID=A0A5C1ASM5_9BACT|nr:hypothetical protein [Limnoglobus roseus]QEL19908.1 hypothetical protein PX52LOC_06990 [Limnoglobus roseus]
MNDELPPLMRMLVGELRRLNLDVEYRGDGDRLHLVGGTGNADAEVLAAVMAGRNRIVAILKPLWDRSRGTPVRLHRDVVAVADREPASAIAPTAAPVSTTASPARADAADDHDQMCSRCQAIVWPNRLADGTGPATCQPHVRTWLGVPDRAAGVCPFASKTEGVQLSAKPPLAPTAAPAPAKAIPDAGQKSLFDARPSA